MNIDGVGLILSLVFSTFGLIYFRYGKRLTRVPFIVIGCVLMVYPYFVSSYLWLILLGLGLMAVPVWIWKR